MCFFRFKPQFFSTLADLITNTSGLNLPIKKPAIWIKRQQGCSNNFKWAAYFIVHLVEFNFSSLPVLFEELFNFVPLPGVESYTFFSLLTKKLICS